MTATVAVTGGTGFIGRRLLARLATNATLTRALCRSAPQGLPATVTVVRGDLQQPDALDTLVDGAEVVVHLAGSVRGRMRDDFDRANLHGTRRLLDACARSARPPKRVVLVSSLAAREPTLSHYAASKRAGEALLQDHPWPFDWIILRPTAVYGPGDTELAPLLQAMARGLAPAPASTEGRVTLVHVDDVVSAIMAASRPDVASGTCLEICDEQALGYSWPELAAAVSAISGRRARVLKLPRGLMNALGHINVSVAALTRHAPMLSPGKVNELYHGDWSCDLQRTLDVLPWTPAVPLAAGLRTVLEAPASA